MKNKDEKCFLWCVLRALNLKNRDNERIDRDLQSKINTLDMGDIKYPVELKDIKKFECLNSNITISVFTYSKEDGVYPLRNSENHDRLHKINLFLIKEEEKTHYCLIKIFSRLTSSQVSKHNGRIYTCERCIDSFKTEKSLKRHEEYCKTNECLKINMPEKGSTVSFKNHWRSERVPFIIYADTESLLKPIQNCESDPTKKYTQKYQKHEPISFSYYIKCFDDNVFNEEPRTYTGIDAMQKFVEWLEEDVRYIANIPSVGMKFGKEEADQFNKATTCWICGGELGLGKVRDHCHYTGKYRGAAHNNCNLKFRKPNFIPVVFHNLSGYDAHLFIKNLGYNQGNINCIPNNDEKYISFTKTITVRSYKNKKGKIVDKTHNIRFIDSFKFMSEGLSGLVNNLPETAFNNIKRYYTGDELNLIKRKGVYPYEYMNSIERFKENSLPPKESFCSSLNNEDISDVDYEHAKKVWDVFKMKSMMDYHELYNKTDVLLLADVFENFRDICLENYKLDPAHYFTAPGLSWDACVKMTCVQLELLTDVDMLLMVEKGIRGGVSMVSKRFSKANNKYMDKKFDSNKPSKYIQYLDANNLYGVAMSMDLPTHGFKWMNDKELCIWEKIPCILEVYLEYPKELHDTHNDYPLAPERIMCKNKVEKLIPNLSKANLLYTDTDSLIYEIETEDFYKDISGDVKDRFDTSNFKDGHPSGIPTGCNKKVLGVFKDEAAGKIIEKFVGLRAKLYSFELLNGEIIDDLGTKKCKGVKTTVVKKSITHNDYEECLFTRKKQLRSMNVLRSYKHEIYTETVNKVALSSDDDKRYVLENSIDTYAWGHHKIPM